MGNNRTASDQEEQRELSHLGCVPLTPGAAQSTHRTRLDKHLLMLGQDQALHQYCMWRREEGRPCCGAAAWDQALAKAGAGGTPHTLPGPWLWQYPWEGEPAMGSAARAEDRRQPPGLTLSSLAHCPAEPDPLLVFAGEPNHRSQNTALGNSTSRRPPSLLPIGTDPSQRLGPGPQLSPNLPSTGNVREIPACPELLQRDPGSAACQDR